MIFWVAILIPGLNVVADEQPDSTISVKRAILDCLQTIESFDISYRNDSYQSSAPEGAYLSRRVAGNRRGDWFHLNSHGSNYMDPADDLLRVEAVVSGNQWRSFRSINRFYLGGQLKNDEQLPGSMAWDDFITATGLWIADTRPAGKAPNHPIALVDVCESPNYEVTLENNEKIRGLACCLLASKNQIDKIWIAFVEDRPTVIRRIQRDAETLAPIIQFDFDQIKLVNGVPIPHRIEVQFFDGQGKVYRDTSYDVTSAKINNVASELFTYKPVAGELFFPVGDNTKPVQTVPGGLDHLDVLASWSQRMGYFEPPQRKTRTWMWIVGCGLIGLVVADVALRSRNRNRRCNDQCD